MSIASREPELTEHGFFFGTKLEETVEWIIGEALRDGSQQAFQAASEQLHGIDRFLLSLGLSIAAMRVSHTRAPIQRLAEDETMRLAWIATRDQSVSEPV
jgi:hypothetical protein